MTSKKGLTTLEKSLILFVALTAVAIGIVVVFIIERNNSSQGELLLLQIQIYFKIIHFAHLLSSDFHSDINVDKASQWYQIKQKETRNYL